MNKDVYVNISLKRFAVRQSRSMEEVWEFNQTKAATVHTTVQMH